MSDYYPLIALFGMFAGLPTVYVLLWAFVQHVKRKGRL